MRNTALAGLFAFAIIAVNSHTASAQTLEVFKMSSYEVSVSEPVLLARISVNPEIAPEPAPKPPEPVVVKYKVLENDNLSKIAESNGTTWKRLFDKNELISDPDVLVIGSELTIPTAEETLVERAVPEPVISAPTPVSATQRRGSRPAVQSAETAPQARGGSAGNTYSAGYCTWYAKNRRSDLPNNLGNANTWVSRAASQGLATGSAPRVGAIGQQGMHVVFVESVNDDGTVTVSEMNYAGFNVVSSRTVPAGTFAYIY